MRGIAQRRQPAPLRTSDTANDPPVATRRPGRILGDPLHQAARNHVVQGLFFFRKARHDAID